MIEHVSIPVAFSAGLVSFFSPRRVPLVPVYFGILCGAQIYQSKIETIRLPLFLHNFSFVLGFSAVFVTIGVLAGLAGLEINQMLLNKIASSLLIFFGIFILAAQKISWLNYEKRMTTSLGGGAGYLRSFTVGVAFSLGWTACISPILGSILALAAIRGTVWQGGILLAVYSLGFGLPFLILGTAFDSIASMLKHVNQYSRIIHIVSSLLFISIGVLILTDNICLISLLVG